MKAWLCAVVLLAACGKDDTGGAGSGASPGTRQEAVKLQDQAQAEALKQAALAREQADRAMVQAQAARARLDSLERELEALDVQVQKAVDAVAAAKNQAELKAASEQLQSLRTNEEALKKRVEVTRRTQGVKISDECIQNPLAKGCN
jgi:chromosome segregation ATPase